MLEDTKRLEEDIFYVCNTKDLYLLYKKINTDLEEWMFNGKDGNTQKKIIQITSIKEKDIPETSISSIFKIHAQ